jgi:hypothetical protein
MGDVEGDAVFLAETAHELFVAVGLVAAQVEVAMGGFYGIAEGEEHAQQGHGIGSAAQCDEHGIVRAEQVLGLDVGADNSFHV